MGLISAPLILYMDKDLSVYLTSLKVFKKCSDVTVKELLRKLENPKNRKSDIKSASLLKDSKSISRADMDINFPDLLKKSMIINNKVAVKGLALPEQKIITTSNYSQAVIDDTLKQVKREISRTSYEILGDLIEFPVVKGMNIGEMLLDSLKSYAEELKDMFLDGQFSKKRESENEKNALDTEKEDLVEKNPKEKSTNSIIDAEKAKADTDKTKGIIFVVLKDKDNPKVKAAKDWLVKVLKDAEAQRPKTNGSSDNKKPESSKIYNYTLYSKATSINVLPRLSTSDNSSIKSLQELSRVSLSFITGLNDKPPTVKESYFQEHKIDFSVKEDLDSKVSDTKSTTSKNKARVMNNPFVRDMLLAGPDLCTNMFDVYLRFNRYGDSSTDEPEPISTSYVYFVPVLYADKNGKIQTKHSEALKSTMNDVYSLSVRTASVDIPMINRGSTDVPFLNTKITKPSGNIEYDMQGVLSVDCDANLYINDMFLALSGLQRDGKFRSASNTFENIKNGMFDHNTHFPFMAPARLGRSNTTIDLIVSSHSLGVYHDLSFNPGNGGFYSSILYVFKDVRFLGGGEIKFSTESDSMQSIDVGFIAKRLETYYKPDNNQSKQTSTTEGTKKADIKASLNFDGRNRSNTIYDEDSIKNLEYKKIKNSSGLRKLKNERQRQGK